MPVFPSSGSSTVSATATYAAFLLLTQETPIDELRFVRPLASVRFIDLMNERILVEVFSGKILAESQVIQRLADKLATAANAIDRSLV